MQPLDALCPRLRWGCRFLRLDHRPLVDKVRDEKALAVLRMDIAQLTDVLTAEATALGNDPDQKAIAMKKALAERARSLAAIEGVFLRRRSLRFAALTESRLYAVDLIGANLTGADLNGADLSGAHLLVVQFLLGGGNFKSASLSSFSLVASLAEADKAAADSIDTLTADTGEIIMAGYINHGRDDVFTKFGDDIYALQRSELLDSRTCNFCLSVDGRIVAKDDSFAANTIFHSNCRGIWVAILKDEAELPPIGGIPKAIRDRFGDAVNELIQPKKPIVRQGSPAAKEAQRRIDRQNQKGQKQG